VLLEADYISVTLKSQANHGRLGTLGSHAALQSRSPRIEGHVREGAEGNAGYVANDSHVYIYIAEYFGRKRKEEQENYMWYQEAPQTPHQFVPRTVISFPLTHATIIHAGSDVPLCNWLSFLLRGLLLEELVL
jgi:hypothetical protein